MNDYIVLRDGIQKEFKFRTSETLGKGQFGKVYKGYDTNGVLFAIKTIDLKEVQKNHNTGSLVYMRREVELMKEISVYSHDNTVNLLASFEKDLVLFLVMECCQTDLAKFIASKQPALGLPEDLCRKFLLQLVTGLKFLNDHHIIHRDLKPPNILLLEDSDYTTLKISDFGLSKKIVDMTSSQVGSPLYMAPEVITHAPYTFKYDVWGAGCIFFEMLTGKSPFDSYKLLDLRSLNKIQKTPNLPIDLLRSINSNSPYKENKIVISDMALELLFGLLTYDQKKRWNWNEVLGCNYFRNDFLKISVLNFPNQASKEVVLPEPVVKKSVDIVIEEKIPKIQNKYRQRRVTCHLFHPYGSERHILLNPGKVYTIQGIKDSTKCQNCRLFNLNGVLYSNDMILLNADCENPNGFEVNDLYFVDFEAAKPPAFRFPQGESLGALPVVPLIKNDSYDAISHQDGRERIGELCALSRARLYNVNLMSQNLLLVLRQLYNTIYSIKIQNKILIVVQSHVYGELIRQKEVVSKYLNEFDILSKQVPSKEEMPVPANNYSETVPVLSSQYNIVAYSQSLRISLETLLTKISSFTSDRESPLKQTFIMENPNFDKNYITPLLASIESVDGSKKQKFQDALAEATKIFKYDFEKGDPPKFPFPESMNLASNASELNAALNLTCLPLYNDINTIYADALQRRSTFETEIDKSVNECYEKLKAFKTLYDQAQQFNEILENLAVGYSQFEKAVKDILGLKVKLTELSRQAKIMEPLGQTVKYCDEMVEKETSHRELFQVKCMSPPLDRLFPVLEPPQKSNVVSNGVLKKEISGVAQLVEMTKHCYITVEDNSNTKTSEPLIIQAIPNNTNMVNKREEEVVDTDLAVKMAQNIRGENGRRRVSSDRLAENIADEREKINTFENRIAEAEKILSKQESEISNFLNFYISVVGDDLLTTFRKNCEMREENGPSIKEQFLSGPYSNPQLQFELWTLKALTAVVLDSNSQPIDKQLEEAKRNLLRSKMNWERAVSFAEL